MALFESKEKKKQREEAEAAARADAEFQASFTAKQERKKVEKMIAEIDKTLGEMMKNAAQAKAKGYTTSYQQYVQFIKVGRARKKQAEMFLFQMDAMQQMQSISKSSSSLLGSMNTIMTSLGKLSLDKSVMMETQRNFASTQQNLDKQSASIEQFLSGMEMSMPEDDDLDTAQYTDSSIDQEIDSLMMTGAIENATATADNGSLDYLKQMLNN